MEQMHHGKIGAGDVFAATYWGSALIINALPPEFLQKCYDDYSAY